MLTVLDLFSGIGGFSLGLERAGMRTISFCEVEPFARRVLAKHWPEVPILGDIEAVETFPAADVIVGGFPCQDISVAGAGAGLTGERSGLWRHLLRAIRLVRPRYAIVENVAALLGRGLGEVVGDLAEIGYDAEWHCIPASAIGAPHRRDRIWIVAYADGERCQRQHTLLRPEAPGRDAAALPEAAGCGADLADAVRDGSQRGESAGSATGMRRRSTDPGSPNMADADGAGLPLAEQKGWDTGLLSAARLRAAAERCGWWATEPDVGRMAHGIPTRVDRLRSLGNAVVPQIPEMIGRAILAAEPVS